MTEGGRGREESQGGSQGGIEREREVGRELEQTSIRLKPATSPLVPGYHYCLSGKLLPFSLVFGGDVYGEGREDGRKGGRE